MKFFLPGCLLALSLTSSAQTLNFQTATPAYPAGSKSHTFTNVGTPAVDIAISVTGPAAFGSSTPKAAGTGYTNLPNFATKTEQETYTFTFSKPVQNLSFSITNIDQSITGSNPNVFVQDQFTLNGVDNTGASITPSISSSIYYTVAGNVITATASNNATAAIVFSGYIKTLTIVFGNGPNAGTSPGSQGFTITTLTWGLVLPVDLTYFRADASGPLVNLAWETAWERNTDQFLVQRSRNLDEWNAVGNQLANGDAESRNTYNFTDEQPLEGLSYYRLQQLDRDGRSAFSKPVFVRVDSNRPAAVIAPNPSNGQQIGLRLTKMQSPTARLSTLTGLPIAGQLLLQSENTATWQPDITLSAGVYLLTLTENDRRQVLTVVVY